MAQSLYPGAQDRLSSRRMSYEYKESSLDDNLHTIAAVDEADIPDFSLQSLTHRHLWMGVSDQMGYLQLGWRQQFCALHRRGERDYDLGSGACQYRLLAPQRLLAV